MIDKRSARQRRARKSRAHMKELGMPRLSVHRSDQHLYAQVIDAEGGKVLAAASTLQKSVNEGLKGMKNKAAAATVGKLIAERAIAAGVQKVAFDRSGFKYHGRIQALADAAREGGLQF